jgi:D-alanyl-D-alanine carboxypeptidase
MVQASAGSERLPEPEMIGPILTRAGRLGVLAAALVAVALLPAAASAAVNLNRELRALTAMPAGPPGAIAVVQRGGRRTLYRAGVRQVGARALPSGTDGMRLASTSKAYSAAVAFALVDRGTLSLSDTIGKWLPELPKAWAPVTLAQLLQHTGGVPDFTQADAFRTYVVKHLHATPSPLKVVSFAPDKLDFTPGSRYQYSNTDNFVIALMAQAATRRSYNQLLSSLIYRPLGLRNTSLPRGPTLARPYIHGYSFDAGGLPEDDSTLVSAAYAWASGGIVATPFDANSFIRADVGAKLFSRATQAKQLVFIKGGSEPTGPGTNSVGLGIFRYQTRCGTVYGHTGNISGYTQFFGSSFDGRRSVTVSISTQVNNLSKGAEGRVLQSLRRIEADAVCQALS